MQRRQHHVAANAGSIVDPRCLSAVGRLAEHAADEISLERRDRDCALAEGIATPCSDRILRPLTVTFSPTPVFEASAIVEALHYIPQLDADLFEEPVDDVVRRLTLLTLERNG